MSMSSTVMDIMDKYRKTTRLHVPNKFIEYKTKTLEQSAGVMTTSLRSYLRERIDVTVEEVPSKELHKYTGEVYILSPSEMLEMMLEVVDAVRSEYVERW